MSIDNHLNNIATRLWDRGGAPGSGRAAVMVGAGFSRNALPLARSVARNFPSWEELARTFVDRLHPPCIKCPGDQADNATDICPQHRIRQRRLRSINETSGASRLALMFESVHGRAALEEILVNAIPDSEYQPGILHQRLVRLPWADIFTTNWDCLLENSVDLYDRSYSTINTPIQIATSRPPRIVKLHGSFGAGTRLTFTEEDFLNYPHVNAPFVSLVQQSMMENVFVLIGFSGEDPNFLHWLSWVRRELGDYIQQVYLVDIADVSEPESRLLAKRGVIPLNIGIFNHIHDRNNYEHAFSRFFDYLERGRSQIRADMEWPERRGGSGLRSSGSLSADTDKAERVAAMAQAWFERVERAPKWLAVPAENRHTIASYIADDGELQGLTAILETLACDPHERKSPNDMIPAIQAATALIVLHEMGRVVPSARKIRAFARFLMALLSLPMPAGGDPLTALLGLDLHKDRGIDRPIGRNTSLAQTVGLVLSTLLRAARMSGDERLFDWTQRQLRPTGNANAHSPYGIEAYCTLLYELALHHLGRSDPRAAAHHLQQLPADRAGIKWSLRKAALLVELNRNGEARDILEKIGVQIRRLRFEPNMHQKITWQKSREGWAYYAYANLLYANRCEFEGQARLEANDLTIGQILEELEERLAELSANRGDPHKEIAAAEAELLEAAYQTRLETVDGEVTGIKAPESAFAYILLMECVGLAPRSVCHTRVSPSPMAVTAAATLWQSHPKTSLALVLRAAAPREFEHQPLPIRHLIRGLDEIRIVDLLSELEERADRLIAQLSEKWVPRQYCTDRLATVIAFTRQIAETHPDQIGRAFRLACRWHASPALADANGTYIPLRRLFQFLMQADNFDWSAQIPVLFKQPHPMREGEIWGREGWPDPFEMLVRREKQAGHDDPDKRFAYKLSPDLGERLVITHAAELAEARKNNLSILKNIQSLLPEPDVAPVRRRIHLLERIAPPEGEA